MKWFKKVESSEIVDATCWEELDMGDYKRIKCEIKTKEGDTITKIYGCTYGQNGKTAGGSIAGSGLQYGETRTDLICIPELDRIKEQISKDLGINPEKISWLDSDYL